MSIEKKKVNRELPPKPEPKKRVPLVEEIKVKKEEKKIVKVEINEDELVNQEMLTDSKKIRTKNPDKYIRFSFNEFSDSNTIQTINKRVINGEIKYAYYAIDNEIPYHYYIIIKNNI